jgi:hypothetical protein
MFKKFNLTFTPETAKYVKYEYKRANTILEYGAGGSTLMAAQLGKYIISTESSAEWMLELMGAYKESNLKGDIIPIHADIGLTKKLGYPVDESRAVSWPDYATKAWRYCAEHEMNPNLILIDGRFRVSCFLASCVFVKQRTKILFDDFQDRPHYHIVKKIAEPVKIVDERLAVFDIQPGQIDPVFLLNNIKYFSDPS